MNIEVLGLTVATTPEPGDTKLKLTTFAGWHSSPSVRSTVEDMPQSDNAFEPARSYRGSKIMSIQGIASGTTDTNTEDLWDTISGLAPMGLGFDVRVTAASGRTRTTRCRLSGIPSVDPLTARRAKFLIPLVAADGRKYGDAQLLEASPPGLVNTQGLVYPLVGDIGGVLDFGPFSPTGLIIMQNGGTADTWPRFMVQGPVGAGGFRIQSSGSIIEFKGGVPDGQSVLLDPYAGGRAFLNGVDVTGQYLTRSEWTSIPPRSSRQYSFNPIGATNVRTKLIAEYREAWW